TGFGSVAAEPELEPKQPLGALASLMPGAKAKHAATEKEAAAAHEAAVKDWLTSEAKRKEKIAAAERDHRGREHKKRESVETSNERIDQFRTHLDEGEPEAVVDYLGMVLDASKYLESFPEGHRLAFVPESRQLVLEHDLPSFDVVPQEKS